MIIFTTVINGQLSQSAWTSLRACCENTPGISYESAKRGKRVWEAKGDTIQIFKLVVNKIKGRGNKNLK